MTRGSGGRAGAALARVPRPVWIAAAILVTVVAAVAALGGFATADARVRPQWPAGEPHDHGQVVATIHDYTVTTSDASSLPEGASAWLVVRATVVSVDAATLVFPRQIVELPAGLALGGDDDPAPDATSVIALDDGRRSPQLHPGLPVEIAYLWPLADAADAPADRLEVEALETRWIYSPSADEWHWGDIAPVARMTIPYTDRVPAVLEGDDE
ncbi:hypothetical protein [Microbacterium sp. Marseille-Q6965]|uniref:hypothetical protein n=1 Tax=Microbacterium sp. Marseille-Q6965 TaxID=2965072 RepID=UPI0021B70C31|nr:hypothetical protein [Microbacterium sp. Marseille-Q6965]